MHGLHISLLSAALAGLIAIWLGARCGSVRGKEKILHGDGGNALLLRRMRAQANFTEYTPFALALIMVLEFAGQAGWALGLSAMAFMLGRILHAIGMDSAEVTKLRMAGMLLTMPLLLGWAIAALLASSAKRCNAKCAVRETVPPAMAAWNCGRVFSLCMQAPRLEPGGTNREQAGSRP